MAARRALPLLALACSGWTAEGEGFPASGLPRGGPGTGRPKLVLMEPPAWAPEDSLMEASEASEREGSDGHEGQSFLSDSNAELVALCEGVQIHTRAEHDDEYDAFFAYEKSTAESDGYKKEEAPVAGHVLPDETHLLTREDLELLRRAVCRKLESFRRMLIRDIDAQWFKSQKDLKHVNEAAEDNIDALYCKAHEKLDPIKKEQQRDKVVTQNEVSGACCCESKESAGLIAECYWNTRYDYDVHNSRETDLCALRAVQLEPFRLVAQEFRLGLNGTGKPSEVKANDVIQLVDKCVDDADWRTYAGANVEKEVDCGPKSWRKACEEPGPKFILRDLAVEEAEYLKNEKDNPWVLSTPATDAAGKGGGGSSSSGGSSVHGYFG